MANTINALVFDVKIAEHLFINDFCDIMKEISAKLDDNQQGVQVLDTFRNKETSIWLDSLDYPSHFQNVPELNNAFCFLLAKDATHLMMEDKKNRQLQGMVINQNFRSKIPSHCVYLKKEKILIMENSSGSATIEAFARGIKNTQEKVVFIPKKRDDILRRLSLFVEKIKTLEIIDLNIHEYLRQDTSSGDVTGEVLDLLLNEESSVKGKIFVEKAKTSTKKKVLDLFKKMLEKFDGSMSFEDLKIEYKNEREQKEIARLFDNLVTLKIDIENYHEDLSHLSGDSRIQYSIQIYKELVEGFYDSKDR